MGIRGLQIHCSLVEDYKSRPADYLITQTCYFIIRTCYFITRACYFITRACYFIARACYFLTRASYFKTRACYFITRKCNLITIGATVRPLLKITIFTSLKGIKIAKKNFLMPKMLIQTQLSSNSSQDTIKK